MNSRFEKYDMPKNDTSKVNYVIKVQICRHAVRQRVDLKIAFLVFQCLTGHAPAYLADDCQLTADASARRHRSADTAKCVVRRTYNNFGDRCFASAGPRLWNTLPLNLRLCDSLGQFKRSLKTFLFGL